jgi:hypothetical protein
MENEPKKQQNEKTYDITLTINKAQYRMLRDLKEEYNVDAHSLISIAIRDFHLRVFGRLIDVRHHRD